MLKNLININKESKHTIYELLGIKFKFKNEPYIKDLKQFAKIIGVKLPKTVDASIPFKRVVIQSYYVKSGDFIIDCGWYNSENLVKESLKKGATAIFCSPDIKEKFPQSFVIAIDNPRDAINKFMKWSAKDCKAKKICITGSIGKTTTTGLINTVVANSYDSFIHDSIENSYGSIFRHAQLIKPKHKYWVQEVGGCTRGYVEASARFLRPDIVVITNISDSHLEHYKTRENIFYDKSSLERYAQKGGAVIINYDDEILRNAQYTHKVITVSLKDPSADYYTKDIVMKKDGLCFTAVCPNCREVNVHLNLYGEFNAYNALYAIAVGELIGLDLNKIPPLLEKYYPSGMRQNHLSVGGFSIFADTFNANPESMFGTAKILEKFPINETGRKIFVSGQMNELGINSPQMHKELGLKLAKLNIDLILLYAGDAQYTYEGLKEAGFKNAILMNSREELDEWIKNNLRREDEIFFKSSHGDICLAITIDNVFGTTLTNIMEFNAGYTIEAEDYKIKIRKYGVMEVAGYKGDKKGLVIPSTYEDHNITRIASYAFKEKNIESIIIPDSIKTICKEAFYRCKNLKVVKLPQSLLYIDKHAFNSCTNLEEIEIPENVIHIDHHAFYDCISLKKAIINKNVGFIEKGAFDNASKDFKIICPKGSYAEQYANDNNIKVSYL